MKNNKSTDKINDISASESNNNSDNYCCPCTPKQLFLLIIPFVIIGFFLVSFLPIFLKEKGEKYKIEIIKNNISNFINEYDQFEQYFANYSYATLTPKNNYNYIYIHLGNINEHANTYFDFFQSNSTIIPSNTKLIFLSGKSRKIKYMEKYNNYDPVSAWFNIDTSGKLICDNCENEYDEAKESLYLILDKIDEIANKEKIEYNKIFLGGYGQGGIMVNYVLLNSRHELGGYCSFSGFFFDHNFPYNTIITNLTNIQKDILDSKKNYHFLATYSFTDDIIPYSNVINSYYNYFNEYTDFLFLSFKNFGFINMPVLDTIKMWIKQRM